MKGPGLRSGSTRYSALEAKDIRWPARPNGVAPADPSLSYSICRYGSAYRPAHTPEGGKPLPRDTAGPSIWSGGVSMRILPSVAIIHGINRLVRTAGASLWPARPRPMDKKCYPSMGWHATGRSDRVSSPKRWPSRRNRRVPAPPCAERHARPRAWFPAPAVHPPADRAS